MRVEAYAAELLVFKRWEEFHREALGFVPSWEAYGLLTAPENACSLAGVGCA